jgi:hypothetical protein
MATTFPSRSFRTLEATGRGALPARVDGKLWVGPGSGKLCSGCGESINSTEQEFESDYSDTLIFRFHAECYDAWMAPSASAHDRTSATGTG